MTDKDLSEIRSRLDALQGAQVAMAGVLNILITPLAGDPRIVAAVRQLGELGKARMLGSRASDDQIAAFDEVMGTLLEKLGGQAPSP